MCLYYSHLIINSNMKYSLSNLGSYCTQIVLLLRLAYLSCNTVVVDFQWTRLPIQSQTCKNYSQSLVPFWWRRSCKKIINENSTRYHCISFKKFRSSHQDDRKRSKQYENYHALFQENTHFQTSWMLYITLFSTEIVHWAQANSPLTQRREEQIGLASTCQPMKIHWP